MTRIAAVDDGGAVTLHPMSLVLAPQMQTCQPAPQLESAVRSLTAMSLLQPSLFVPFHSIAVCLGSVSLASATFHLFPKVEIKIVKCFDTVTRPAGDDSALSALGD